jgi:hypothetical protein
MVVAICCLPEPFLSSSYLAVLARVVERRDVCAVDLGVGDRDVEAVTEALEVVLGELLHLVGRVAAREGLEQPALDGVGQDDRRLTRVLLRGVERCVDLAVVVAASGETLDLLVGQVLDHLAEARVGAEEVLPVVGTGLDRQGLELAVGRTVHLVDQDAVGVAGEQVVPLASPDDLDDVPAGATERGLELLDDLAVAAHGTVELLQVAVDDEREVVELLAGRDADRAERLGLAHLTVAEERPHVLLARVLDATVVQVTVEPRLVDRVDGAESHRDSGELPVVRHEARVRVGRQAVAGAV